MLHRKDPTSLAKIQIASVTRLKHGILQANNISRPIIKLSKGLHRCAWYMSHNHIKFEVNFLYRMEALVTIIPHIVFTIASNSQTKTFDIKHLEPHRVNG